MISKYFIILFVFVLFACKSARKEKMTEICCINTFTQKIEKVSLKDVERIKSLHGKLIEVEGFYRSAFEESALCPSEKASILNSLWADLKFSENQIPDSLIDEFRNKWVLIVAQVDTTMHGHLGGYIGTLGQTFCIKEIR